MPGCYDRGRESQYYDFLVQSYFVVKEQFLLARNLLHFVRNLPVLLWITQIYFEYTHILNLYLFQLR